MEYSVHLCVLMLSIFGVQQGWCIQCYSCVSSTKNDACAKLDRNKFQLQKCNMDALEKTKKYSESIETSISTFFELDMGSHEPQVPMNCLKQVTKVAGREVVLRGCQLAATDNLDICVKMKEVADSKIQTTYCSLCNSDACNAASSLLPTIFTFAFVVVLPYC